MRPRTLARKKLKPILSFFQSVGDCMAPCGLSYHQKAIARAQYAVERNLDDSLIVCSLLYDLDELLIQSNNEATKITVLNKDKHAAAFLKMTFPEHIIKPLRLKTITQQYASQSSCLEKGTAKLFEESPWFFACMSVYQIEKKLTDQASLHSHSLSDINSFEEVLLSQTLILSNKEKQNA